MKKKPFYSVFFLVCILTVGFNIIPVTLNSGVGERREPVASNSGVPLNMKPKASNPDVMYTESIDLYTYSIGGSIEWSHTYDGSADPIESATLTIVADDVDGPGSGMDGEQDEVYFNGYYLG
ncbi:MAG: hypothetical protein ACFFBP_24000, partial [Promethearchaeota archaeon]